jgi:hypothetical protein
MPLQSAPARRTSKDSFTFRLDLRPSFVVPPRLSAPAVFDFVPPCLQRFSCEGEAAPIQNRDITGNALQHMLFKQRRLIGGGFIADIPADKLPNPSIHAPGAAGNPDDSLVRNWSSTLHSSSQAFLKTAHKTKRSPSG